MFHSSAVTHHHLPCPFDVGGVTAAQRQQVSVTGALRSEHHRRVDESDVVRLDDAGKSLHEFQAVGAGRHDQLTGLAVGDQFFGDGLHLVVGAQACDENVGLLGHFGQSGCRCGAAGRGRGQSIRVDVVGDDVEAATGHHVPAHRKPHIADADDPDHVVPFFYLDAP